MSCVVIKSNKRRPCIGSLKALIDIQARVITPPENESTDYTETFTDIISVRAMIQTVSGKSMFDKTNVERDLTHKFTLRYMPDITFQNWVKYNSQYYDILRVENIDEANRWYVLYCSIRGSINNPANEA